MKKTYWSVYSSYGRTILFDNYNDAKRQSKCEYCGIPVKHTVKAETFEELKKLGAFYHEK